MVDKVKTLPKNILVLSSGFWLILLRAISICIGYILLKYKYFYAILFHVMILIINVLRGREQVHRQLLTVSEFNDTHRNWFLPLRLIIPSHYPLNPTHCHAPGTSNRATIQLLTWFILATVFQRDVAVNTVFKWCA